MVLDLLGAGVVGVERPQFGGCLEREWDWLWEEIGGWRRNHVFSLRCLFTWMNSRPGGVDGDTWPLCRNPILEL